MSEGAGVGGAESKGRKALAWAWLALRWAAFFPAGLAAGYLIFAAIHKTWGSGAGAHLTGALAVAAASGASVLIASLLGPNPFVCGGLMAVTSLVLTTAVSFFLDGSATWLVGWAAGVAAASFRKFRRPSITRTDIRHARWLLFYPAAMLAGLLTGLAAGILLENWAKRSGYGTTERDPAGVAVLAVAALLGSAAYTMAGAWIAPASRAVTVLLMANVSFFVVFGIAERFPGWSALPVVLCWAAGTMAGAYLPVRSQASRREAFRRAAAGTERKGRRYKGTAPYQDLELDRQTFFGREQEARHFQNLVLGERLVVLFAKSGMGKSSLINAGLLDPLRKQGYFPFVARLNDPSRSLAMSLVSSARQAAAAGNVDIAGADDSSAWRFFKTAEFWSERDDLLRPVVILDQFEELFTLHGPWPRKEFASHLAELVRGRARTAADDAAGEAGEAAAEKKPVHDPPPNLKIVIALREDFLANLQDLAGEIPAILHNRFRLGPLSSKAAREAIVEPAGIASEVFETGRFSYDEAAVDRIVAFLAKRRMGTETAEDDEVEPVQLQLICRYLEESVLSKEASRTAGGEMRISEADLGGEEQMQQVLEGFYDRTIATVRPWRKARAVRRMCEQRLISGGGRRLTEDEEEIRRRYRISQELLRQLVDARLLRAEPRLGGTFYEISHDRLVEPILKSRRRREVRRRRVALAAAPLVLTVAISVTVRVFERHHQETEVRSRLLETDPEKAIESAMQLVGTHNYSRRTVLGMAEPLLNPATFVVFAMPSSSSWDWGNTDQAKQVLAHTQRAYPTFLAACRGIQEAEPCGRILTGSILATLDHARRNQPDLSGMTEEMRRSVLDLYRRNFPPPAANTCDGDGAIAARMGGGATRIQPEPVSGFLYKGCLGPAPGVPKPDLKKSQIGFDLLQVTWFEAIAYAALRGGRLPSEEELEKSGGRAGLEWLAEETPDRVIASRFQRPSLVRRPFRVVWDGAGASVAGPAPTEPRPPAPAPGRK